MTPPRPSVIPPTSPLRLPLTLSFLGLLATCTRLSAISEFQDGQDFSARFGHTDNPRFVSPSAMAVDPATGKLFVADWNGDRVLRYSSAQKLAENGEPEAVFGQRSVAETLRQDSIVSTTLRGPAALAWDHGSLWVAEFKTRRVVRFNDAANAASGAPAAQVLGYPDFAKGTLNYHTPYPPLTATTGWAFGLAVDTSGSLWLSQGSRVIRFDSARFRGNMPSADGVLGQPDLTTEDGSPLASPNKFFARTIAAHGTTLWIMDENNARILRFDNARSLPDNAAASGVLGAPDLITKGGGLTNQLIGNSGALSFDPAGNLLLADYNNYRVLRWRAASLLSNGARADSVFWQPNFTSSLQNVLPASIIADADGRFFVNDLNSRRILRVESSPATPFTGSPAVLSRLSEQSDNFVSEQHLEDPAAIAIDPISGKVFVTDRKHHRVLRFPNWQALREGIAAEWVIGQPDLRTDSTGPATRSNLKLPRGLAVSPTGHLFVADSGHHRILRFANAATRSDSNPEADAGCHFGQSDFSSEFPSISSTGLDTPASVAIDASNHLWVADQLNHRVIKFNNATAANPDRSADLVVGQTSLNGFNWGTGPNQFTEPTSIALDPAGRLWVADSRNQRVQRFDNANSLPSANASASNSLGQASPASASLIPHNFCGIYYPEAVASGPDGSIFVADSGYHRVLQYRAEDVGSTNRILPHRVLGQPNLSRQRLYDDHYSGGHLETPLRSPQALAVAPNGSLLIAEPWRHSILIASPALVDSDNDGWLDAAEIDHGSNPASAASTPATSDPGSYALNFYGRVPEGVVSPDLEIHSLTYAGIVLQQQWRNVSPDLTGGYPYTRGYNDPIFNIQSSGAADLTIAQPGQPLPLDGNSRLMHGSMICPPETRCVADLYNIPWQSYDVCVYFDGPAPDNRSDFTVTSLTKSESLTGLRDVTDWNVTTESGSFIGVQSNGAAGNVAIFKNHSGGRLRIVGRAGIGGSIAAINAIQIISHGRVRIISLVPSPQLTATSVTWDALPGRFYTLQSSSDLKSWQSVATRLSPLPLDQGHGSFTQQHAAAPRRFYRVIME
jgi:sugar lactone lactonase YvrE